MAKPKGYRAPDYEERRDRLLDSMLEALARPKSELASLSTLAEAAGVTTPTLRHYFGNRDGLVISLLEKARREGEEYLQHARQSQGCLVVSLRSYLGDLVDGFHYGLGNLHAIGLTEGIGHQEMGPAYLMLMWEPTLEAVETRLEKHHHNGELRECDLRQAALMLVGPVLWVLLHQYKLGGITTRPLDVEQFLEQQIQAFVRAYGVRASI
ncbi:MAG: TetR/AcrR family transcriptional regulator [Synechococcaceae cyanobacterium SM2_3_1]|nr:TetR/AcrR family transcriptional regulator [Synechococcaceae cyanobacterium SM2_3_1]